MLLSYPLLNFLKWNCFSCKYKAKTPISIGQIIFLFLSYTLIIEMWDTFEHIKTIFVNYFHILSNWISVYIKITPETTVWYYKYGQIESISIMITFLNCIYITGVHTADVHVYIYIYIFQYILSNYIFFNFAFLQWMHYYLFLQIFAM